MIRLRDLLNETSFNKENRINLMKITTLMEKLIPELTKSQSTKLIELCSEINEMVIKLNEIPYTVFNHTPEWKLLEVAFVSKLAEVKVEAEKLLNSDKVDVRPFIKAIDEIIVN